MAGWGLEYRKIKRPFPRTARAHSVVPPALPDASPTPRRAADAPTLGAQQACYARDGFKRAYSEKPARYETDATLWHTRRRCGDWYKQWDRAHCRNERPVQTRASVQNAASGPGKGCSTRATTGRTGETLTQASQTSPPTCNVRGAAGAGLDRALGPPRAGALGDGAFACEYNG
jgi:hypothetical protein